MKLNNKGFAISVLLYSIIAIVILTLTMILSVYATNLHNKTSLADSVKNKIIDKEVVNYDNLNLSIQVNPEIPEVITKGDNYLILGSYSLGQLGGNVTCSIDGYNVSDVNSATTSSLNVGRHIIVCKVNASDNTELQDIKIVYVTYDSYNIKNLMINGSFENDTGWELTDASIVNGGYVGSKALKLSGNKSLAEAKRFLSDQNPIVNHKYYGAIMFKSGNNFNVSNGVYEYVIDDVFNGRMIFAKNNVSSTDWTRLSYVQHITSNVYFDSEDWWKIVISVNNANMDSYVDGVMLIDLTDAFGEGNEPTRKWCDEHINYFEGTTSIYK